ncbi:phosphopantetheine-binding protein, partial [Dokdonia pacifica]|uniref:phosphopantetheine-binding protein n=1 Tax=Dokdonia pacifica TaxID=1627892 RepID=UPI001E4FDE90
EDVSGLRSYLSDILPDYMLPSYYVQVGAMPLTSNGKIDKRSLPSPLSVGMSSGITYVAPVTKEQQVLVSVLETVLKRPSIGLQDNFYNLGGDSIKSIQVVSRLKQEGYSLKVSQLLHTPVVEELAVFLSENTHVIDQSMVSGAVSLTPIQAHFFTDSHIENRSHFNQSVLLQSTIGLDTAVIDRCISELVSHHDALRMTYREVDGKWQQHNELFSENSYEVLFYDLTSEAEEQAKMG